MSSLLEKLEQLETNGTYPFHMPGHKRQYKGDGVIPYGIDITEITGYDNLHAPEEDGIIWQMYERGKKLYGTYKSYPLVNGSTCGLMAAITACCKLNEEIIIARNCHKAVYRTCELLGLRTNYIYPEYLQEYGIFGEIDEKRLDEYLITHKESKAVVITSPTYEGVILDIGLISKVVHKHGMILIVDEAHGAHLPFCKRTWSGIHQGADFVIQSLHKTLPSLTQTAVLHLCQEAKNRPTLSFEKIDGCVSLYQSTSPSYVLMAAMAECLEYCEKMEGKQAFAAYYNDMKEYRKSLADLKCLTLIGNEFERYDYGKVVIGTKNAGISGRELFCELQKRGLECEMAARDYVVAMTSICDSKEGLDKLRVALYEIDGELERTGKAGIMCTFFNENVDRIPANVDNVLMTLREAMDRPKCKGNLQKIKFQLDNDYVETSSIMLSQVYQMPISGDYIMIYPPGIPLIAPGERFTKEIVDTILSAKDQGLTVIGVEDEKVSVLI